MSGFLTVATFAMIWITIEILQAIYENETVITLIPMVAVLWIGAALMYERWRAS